MSIGGSHVCVSTHCKLTARGVVVSVRCVVGFFTFGRSRGRSLVIHRSVNKHRRLAAGSEPDVEIGDEVSILSSRKFGTVQIIDRNGLNNIELCGGSERSCMGDEIGLRRIITDARIGVSDDKAFF